VLTTLTHSPHRKGVSFLSRFIGTKRKDALSGHGDDNESEAGDRPEGMDAQLFSQPFDNLGFSPKYPQPPAYIKVRTKSKKEKEFNRLFLAQELRSKKTSAEKKKEGTLGSVQSGSAATNDPVWATEFSKDGKYLAAGGQDKIVRVWAVISTPEERRRHEKEEADGEGAGDRRLQLTAPVFQSGTFREYVGHTATILDLSWSKVSFSIAMYPYIPFIRLATLSERFSGAPSASNLPSSTLANVYELQVV
jgi:WD40 repeat protein